MAERETQPDYLFTPLERELLTFDAENRELHEIEDAVAKAKEAQYARLRRWQEKGVILPIRAWARYKLVPDETGALGKIPYFDGESHSEAGGWTPPDHYRLLRFHTDAVLGHMVWMEPIYVRGGVQYDVLADRIAYADDALISAHWNGSQT